jgi:hypothetical protein
VTGEDVRALCLSLPNVTEKPTWGDDEHPPHPTFRIRDKIFVILATDETGGSIRTSHGEQAGLMSAFPGSARSASHVGRFGWVEVDFAGIPDEVLRETIEAAWARTAPKKVAAAWLASR